MFRRSFIIRSTGSVLAAIALTACDNQEPTATTKTVNADVVGAPVAAVNPRNSTYEIMTHSSNVGSGFTGVVEVLCTTGKRSLGGGFFIEGGILIEGADVAVYESSPRVTSGGNGASGWRLVAANRTAESRLFNVYAICATI